MPIWLRNLTFIKINDFYEKQHQASKGNAETSWVDPSMKSKVKKENKKISPPNFTQSKPTKSSYK